MKLFMMQWYYLGISSYEYTDLSKKHERMGVYCAGGTLFLIFSFKKTKDVKTI